MGHLSSRLTSGVAVAAMTVVLTACDLTPLVEARDEWRRQYPLSSGGSVELRETNGRFEITAGDGDAVEIVATRIGKGVDDAAAKHVLSRIEIREDIRPDRIVIDSTGQHTFGFRESKQVNYVVRMPRQASLTIKSTNGAIEVSSIGGAVRIETTNGDVKATGLGGSTSVTATNGAISLDFARVGGAISCETTNGKIDLILPRDAGAELSARLTNGAIQHSNLKLNIQEDSRRRLDATIGGGGPEIRLETTNGAIDIRGR